VTAASSPGTSTGVLIVALVLDLVCGAAAFGLASQARIRNGHNPWGVPPALWLLIGFFLNVLGALLAMVATLTSSRSAQPPATRPLPGPRALPGPRYASPTPRATGASAGTAGAPAAATTGPPPGWYADPSGRHQFREWTGSAWTDHVFDEGFGRHDPLPPYPGVGDQRRTS
jgi:hypothetical protein